MQPIDIGDESRSSLTTPAPIDARLGAGCVDSLAVIVLTALFIVVPLRLTGLMTPTLAMCGAVLIWTIAPLWLFRQTLGMRLFGIEMVSKTGHSADLSELLFRELVGRGYLPAIYLVSLIAAVVLRMMGYAAGMVSPSGFALVATGMSFLFLALAVTGNAVAFMRADRRTLADLIAKTMVIPRRPLPEPEDEDDRQLAKEERFRKIRGLVIFSTIVSVIAVAAPWIVTRRPASKDVNAIKAKKEREQLQYAFSKDPTNQRVAYNLSYALRSEGDEEEAKVVLDEHKAAVKKRDDAREALLKERYTANANDEEAMDELLGLYVDQNRLEDGKALYKQWVDGHPTDNEYAGFGVWLYKHDFNDDAVEQMKKGIELGNHNARTQAYLGFALQELGRDGEAKEAFQRALEIDPDMAEVQSALESVEESEPEPRPKRGTGK